MNTMNSILAVLSIVSAVVTAGLAGYFAALRNVYKSAQEALSAEREKFDAVTRAASQANNSIAEQVIAIGNKVKVLEDKIGMIAASQPRGRS